MLFHILSLSLWKVKIKKIIIKLPTQKKLYKLRYIIWLENIEMANHVSNKEAEINIPFIEILIEEENRCFNTSVRLNTIRI